MSLSRSGLSITIAELRISCIAVARSECCVKCEVWITVIISYILSDASDYWADSDKRTFITKTSLNQKTWKPGRRRGKYSAAAAERSKFLTMKVIFNFNLLVHLQQLLPGTWKPLQECECNFEQSLHKTACCLWLWMCSLRRPAGATDSHLMSHSCNNAELCEWNDLDGFM